MTVVDAHTHLGSDLYAGEKTGRGDLAAADRYVKILKENEVDKGFAFTLSGLFQDPQLGNDDLARARDRYPDAIIPWGTVDPYWDEKKLRREMRRCIRELGFAGFKFHPWTQGFSMTDPGMEVVAEECVDMGVPVTSHDGTAFNCTALQVVYYARAHPELRVLSGHGGLREGWRDVIQPARELDNYWICLAGVTQQGIQILYDQLGPDKLLFGSDGGAFHPATTADYVRRVRALKAPERDVEKILGLNALRFLNNGG
jgi:predicted TIM-barrel fold metal-dependent hydrolase